MRILIKLNQAILAALLVLMFAGICQAGTCKARYGDGNLTFKLATGSPGELGLLKELAREFNAKPSATMCWVKAGSGKSLKLLNAKSVDMVMVHAPAAEKKPLRTDGPSNGP